MSAATTEITTEYGIRQPNGNELWGGRVTTRPANHGGGARERTMAELHESPHIRRDFLAQLKHTADAAGVEPLEFVSGHRLITRQLITITLPAEDAPTDAQLGTVADAAPWNL